MSSPARSPSAGDRRRLWPALALIVVPFLGLIGMQGYEALSRLPRTALGQSLVAHSFNVIITAQSLRTVLQDAERSQRNYLLTGRSADLEPYRAARARVPGLLATLTRLTFDEPQQQRELPGLAARIDAKLAEVQAAVDAYGRGGWRSARPIVESSAGRRDLQTIERRIDAMTAWEDKLLSQRLAKVVAQEHAIQRIATASTLLAAALMMSGMILILFNYRKGRRLQWELSRRAEDVAQANRELERRNGELAHATEVAREAQEEARQAERTKGRFLATASHDLRQPLQAVSLLNGALRRTARDPEVTDVLRQQNEAIGAMNRLLNALLDISKLESGAVKPAPVDFAVAPLLEAMAREFRGLAASKGLDFDIEPCEACAHSDPALIEQILRNLISNAIKYTCAGRVRVRTTTDAPWVTIEVIDTGVGIEQDQIRLLGEEFYQLGVSGNASRQGYGLGLSIVRRLVQLLGLGLEIRSEVGCGSTFSVRLPMGIQPAATPQKQDSPGLARVEGTQGVQILLVEDDPDVRNATRMLLKAEGYGVAAAASSLEAVRKAHEERDLALVVTDFHLGPGETGVQVILSLREILQRPVKAILITGDTSSAIKELPPDPNLRVLSKPVQAEVFLSLVRELLVA